MAKSLPLVAPRNFILRTKVHCSKCESKTKLFLERIPGLHSATINRKEGTVAISGTIRPSQIITLLEQAIGLKADLLWDQTPTPPPSPSPSSKDAKDLQIIASQSRIVESDNYKDHDQRFTDPYNQIISQLNQLSGQLESVEIKLNFSRENHGGSNGGDVKVVIHGGGGSHDVSNGGFLGHDVRDGSFHGHGVSNGGFRGHDVSNVGSRGHDVSNGEFRAHDVSNERFYDHAHGYPVTSSFNSCPNLQWPPPWTGSYSPSAPPCHDDPLPPPPPAPMRDGSFFNQFSDDNTSSCIIM